MNEEQIATVKSTWSMVVPIAGTAADLFYGKLFELDPAVRAMFPESMEEQKQKLMQTLGRLVAGLDKIEEVVPAVQQLGRRHVGYGVEESHYPVVGAALLWTLEQGLGEHWDAEVQDAWSSLYSLVSRVMIEAARESTQMAAEVAE